MNKMKPYDRDFALAIYYFDAQVISRSKGQSVVACAAYRSADKIYDERYDKLHDYTLKKDVTHSEILLPDGSPAWMKDRAKLWNAVEAYENRKDAQLAREIRFALPRELTFEQNKELARRFIQDNFVNKGMIADWSIHNDRASDGKLQPHVHLLATMRSVIGDSFGPKVREWNQKNELLGWRAKFSDYANYDLAKNGHDVRIDHRTLAEQGINLIPQDKVGNINAQHRLEAFRTQQRAARENGDRILNDPNILFTAITKQQSTFNDHDIARFVSRYTADAEQFQEVYLKVKASDQLLPLGLGDDGRERYTTREMFELENSIKQSAESLAQRKHIKISSQFIDKTINEYAAKTQKTLTDEQLLAVKHLLDADSISSLVGLAGTGKSFSLGAANAVWQAKGLRVHGIALSAVAADGLEKGSGIDGRTIASFNYAIEKGKLSLGRNDVIVMDEAGMTDSISMGKVISAIKEAKAKLVLVGDPDQLQPVGPGAMFRWLLQQYGFVEIVTVYRQKQEWQKQATRDFAAGEIEKGLLAYEQRGFLHMERSEALAMNKLVTDWETKLSEKSVEQIIVIAYTNEQVTKLNQMVRNKLIERNELAEGFDLRTKDKVIKIAKNDRLLFLKNDSGLDVKNGHFATVTNVDFSEAGKVLNISAKVDGTEKIVTFNPENYNDVDYGYAATVHKLQGATYEDAFNYVGGHGWDRYLTYVANTRHKDNLNIYVNKENYPDLEQLALKLGRTTLKDSVLDYPRAFAALRGIENNLTTLTDHLSTRLSQLKDRIKDKYELWASPETYWQNKKQALEKEALIEERYQRRKDSQLVAAYVDINRVMAYDRQTLQTKMESFGINQIDYKSETYQLVQTTPEYSSLKENSAKRDKIALEIMLDSKRYLSAIKAAGLSLKKMEAEAMTEIKRETIAAYKSVSDENKWVIRDKIAANILADLKGHYRLLKEANIDTSELRQHALTHLKRERMIGASPNIRETYRLVHKYQEINRQIAKNLSHEKEYYGEEHDFALKYKDGVHRIGKLKENLLERGRLASIIMKNPERFDSALDFYQIGTATKLFAEIIEDNHKKTAQQRWYKLQGHAAYFNNHQRINEYQTALNNKDKINVYRLAHEIMLDVKSHHGAILELSTSSQELWRSIRKDAKQYERENVFNQLNPTEKIRFLEVEKYLEAKRAHALSWREIFNLKEHRHLSNEELGKVIQFANVNTEKRDLYANKIFNNLNAHKAGLEYYKVNTEELNISALQHQLRSNVENYISEKDYIRRAKIATSIVADPKAHYQFVKQYDLNFKTLYIESKHAERKDQFDKLSEGEKKFHRLATRYRSANITVGKYYGKLEDKDEKNITQEDKNKLNLFFAKRDYLAWGLVEIAKELNPECRDTIFTHNKLNIEKINKQHLNHENRLATIAMYNRQYKNSLEIASEFWLQVEKNKINTNNLKNVISSLYELKYTLKRYEKNNLDYALISQNISKKDFDQKIENINNIDTQLKTLMNLHKIDEKQFKPITKLKTINKNNIDLNRLNEDLKERALEVSYHYLGQPKSAKGGVLRYGKNKGSLIVNIAGKHQGLWRDFQTDEGGNMLKLIQRSINTPDFKEVLREATRFLGGESTYETQTSIYTTAKENNVDQDLEKRLMKVKEIAAGTIPIQGTLAEKYLREHRGIKGNIDSQTLKYHPNLKNWMTGSFHPALIALARNEQDEVCGLQAIFLDKNTAKKAALEENTKLSRGLIGEGAMVHRGSAQGKIAFAEGIETALSVADGNPDWTVYVTFGVSNFSKVPVKTKAQSIVICADNDGVDSGTAKSVDNAAKNLSMRGIDVWVSLPEKPAGKAKYDFNDLLLDKGSNAVKIDLDKAFLKEKGVIIETLKTEALSTIDKALKPHEKEYLSGTKAWLEKLESFKAAIKNKSKPLDEHRQPAAHDKPHTITSEEKLRYEEIYQRIKMNVDAKRDFKEIEPKLNAIKERESTSQSVQTLKQKEIDHDIER